MGPEEIISYKCGAKVVNNLYLCKNEKRYFINLQKELRDDSEN